MRAIIMTGAQIVTASDSLERWDHIANMVKEQSAFPATNYLDPPVGSNHFGLDGFKTIAYELFEELGPDLVDAVLVPRSEEHTSELQSLMSISYDVFCLNKKKRP